MRYEVDIMPSAKADIFEIRLWLLENAPDHADIWLWRCSEAATSLRAHPLRGRISEEGAAFDFEVRELLFGDRRNVYRMLFTVAGSKVNILRIRSTRQKRLIDSIDDE